MSIVLGEYLVGVISQDCYHVAGHVGSKKAVRDVKGQLTEDSHVMKSDVKSYYASIDHHILYA
jgi:hypothetical protein